MGASTLGAKLTEAAPASGRTPLAGAAIRIAIHNVVLPRSAKRERRIRSREGAPAFPLVLERLPLASGRVAPQRANVTTGIAAFYVSISASMLVLAGLGSAAVAFAILMKWSLAPFGLLKRN